MKHKILMLLGGCALMVATSCSTKTENNMEKAPAATVNVVDSTSAYICPMKCEGSGSMNPGKCPMCNMDLVSNPDNKTNASSSAADTIITSQTAVDSTVKK